MSFTPKLEIQTLGSGKSIGKTAILLRLSNKFILFDYGLDPVNLQPPIIPNLKNIHILLVSHAHLDHVGAIPLLYKLGYRGKIVMSKETLRDSIKTWKQYLLANGDKLYDEVDVDAVVELVEFIQAGETRVIHDILIQTWNAGHVKGSLGFYCSFNGRSCVFTGDFLKPNIPKLPQVDVLITEGTYSNIIHPSKQSHNVKLLEKIRNTLKMGGNVLIPVKSLNATRILTLVVQDFKRFGLEYPIYTSKTFESIDYDMTQEDGESIHFEGVETISDTSSEPMVLIASPSNLEGGDSLKYLEKWQDSSKNLIILPGYHEPGSISSRLILGWKQIKTHETLFALHDDLKGILKVIDWIRPSNVVLIHGGRLDGLGERIVERGYPCFIPSNGDILTINCEKTIDAEMDFDILKDVYVKRQLAIQDGIKKEGLWKTIQSISPFLEFSIPKGTFVSWKEPMETSVFPGKFKIVATIPSTIPE